LFTAFANTIFMHNRVFILHHKLQKAISDRSGTRGLCCCKGADTHHALVELQLHSLLGQGQKAYLPVLLNSLALAKCAERLSRFHRREMILRCRRPVLSLRRAVLKSRSRFLSLQGAEREQGESLRLRKEIWTVPNMITISRIVASPCLAFAIVNDMKEVALIGCCVAGFSDWLDGYIAKNYNQMTVLGGMLDPIADKVMIGCLSLGLAFKGLLPLPLAGVVVGRDVMLLAASFYLRHRERPMGAPFFDTTYSATFEITPSTLSKVNTGVQFVLLASTLSNFAIGAPALPYIEPLWYLTALTTIGSGIGYMDGTGVRRISKSGVGRGLDEDQYHSHRKGDGVKDEVADRTK